MFYLFFFFNFYLFMIVTERERQRGRDTGRGRSRTHAPGARRGIQSRVSRIAPWAKGRRQTAAPPRDPQKILIRTPDIVSPSSSLYTFWESPHCEPLLVLEMVNVTCQSNVLGTTDFKGMKYIWTNYYRTVDWFKLMYYRLIFIGSCQGKAWDKHKKALLNDPKTA